MSSCQALLQCPAFKEAVLSVQCPDEFVVGYGMDYNGLYRSLPYVGVLRPSVYSS